ncbi:MAG: glycosyltransferase family 1 protein [Candidatus Pacebacteria bacterium]|nr:glycosyltransferase family 1 protein [Candidatus Paceibacterota bacterium]
MDFEPALERQPTGIANVTMGIASGLLERAEVQTFFFSRNKLLPRSFVLDYVSVSANRAQLAKTLASGGVQFGNLNAAIEKFREGTKIGIYPNVKFLRPGFDFELQIIHDLTYLKYPQLHTMETVNFYLNHFMNDINSNDLSVCDSDTTRHDLLTYAPHVQNSCTVIYPGVAGPADPIGFTTDPIESKLPFFLLIGTVEPRKNLRLVAELLRSHPELSRMAEFVHIGRRGWIEKFNLSTLPGVRALGYVDDNTRWRLLHAARALIFPSLYEGFGLPLIEAARMGTMTISSLAGSLPEIAEPSTTVFFDPTSVKSFHHAILSVLIGPPPSAESKACLVQHSASFSWKRYVEQLIQEIDTRLAKPRMPWIIM